MLREIRLQMTSLSSSAEVQGRPRLTLIPLRISFLTGDKRKRRLVKSTSSFGEYDFLLNTLRRNAFSYQPGTPPKQLQRERKVSKSGSTPSFCHFLCVLNLTIVRTAYISGAENVGTRKSFTWSSVFSSKETASFPFVGVPIKTRQLYHKSFHVFKTGS